MFVSANSDEAYNVFAVCVRCRCTILTLCALPFSDLTRQQAITFVRRYLQTEYTSILVRSASNYRGDEWVVVLWTFSLFISFSQRVIKTFCSASQWQQLCTFALETRRLCCYYLQNRLSYYQLLSSQLAVGDVTETDKTHSSYKRNYAKSATRRMKM